MSWQSKIPREGTEPEQNLWSILDEMKAEKIIENFARNDFIDTPFRDYPIQADVLVDDVLVIEVQSDYFHSKMVRARKDQHKAGCFEMMGMGVLWLYDDELNKATIPKYRLVWRPAVISWIVVSLGCAKKRRMLWLKYMNESAVSIRGEHPDLGAVSLRGNSRRL